MMELVNVKNASQPVLPPVKPFDRSLLAQRVRLLRLRLGVQGKTVAEATGLDPTKISKFETGKARMFFDQAVLLARVYNVSLDELAGEGEEDGSDGRNDNRS